ncbi:MAG TPA: hypothetical protein VGN12_26200 [Pirellulales bacterium]|jgi:hypothetical protein
MMSAVLFVVSFAAFALLDRVLSHAGALAAALLILAVARLAGGN